MNSIAATIQKEKRYLMVACGVMLGLFVLYVYFLSATVVHVVVRKEVTKDITELYTQISNLEAEYIDAQHSVSGRLSSLDGFVETQQKIFIDRRPSTLVLNTTP